MTTLPPGVPLVAPCGWCGAPDVSLRAEGRYAVLSDHEHRGETCPHSGTIPPSDLNAYARTLKDSESPVVRCSSCGLVLTRRDGWTWAHPDPLPKGVRPHPADPRARDLIRWRKWRDGR